jgi:DNA polymerase-3 subunit gamma/tau
MSYQVLARKWRPKQFQEMVGQEPILRMLANALEQKRIHHAYLFTGTRGVGKTTLARLLAKCLNCAIGITSTPCGTCHTCIAIDKGQFLDLYEVDAASRTKVEDTRELLDNVLYPPTQGRYKIYLIDEVHMLSNHSFNALLKTLEEPPEHVKFLLATTDPKRLPITILSRCLQFHLKRITPEQIAKHLQHVCDAENIKHEIAALDKLAKAAEGSMRDALSLLDQAIAYGHGEVQKTEVNAMLGSMAQDDLLPLLYALAEQNGAQLFKTIALLAERAPDFHEVLDEFASMLHQIAIAQIVPNTVIEESLADLGKRFKPEEIQLYYQIVLLGKRDLSLTASPQQGFEMTMLRLLAFKPSMGIQESTISTKEVTTLVPAEIVEKKTNIEPAPVLPIQTDLSQWRDLLPKLELSGMAYALAANCTLEAIHHNKVVLTLSVSHQPMLNPKLKERIAESLSRHFKQPMQLDINVTTAELCTPLKQAQSEHAQQLTQATQTILQNPHIKKLLDMYDATLEVALV